MNEPDTIRIWRFYEAPQHLQAFSENGGDEDWLAEIPASMYDSCDEYCGLLNSRAFGCCSVDDYPHPDKPGWYIRIGAHA